MLTSNPEQGDEGTDSIKVYCDYEKCWREITSREDLMATALLYFIPQTFHRQCYAEMEKDISYQLFYINYPINWGLGNVLAGLSPLLAILFFAKLAPFGLGWALLGALLGAWPGILRLIVYYAWERHLPPY